MKSPDVQNLSDVKHWKLDWDMLSGDKLKPALGQGSKSIIGTDGQGHSSGKAPLFPSMTDLPKVDTKSRIITLFPCKASEGVGEQTPLTHAIKTSPFFKSEFQIWANGLKEAIEMQFHEVEDKILHLIVDNNFLMNRLTPWIELEKATLDGQGVTRVLISDADVDVLKKEVFDYTKELWSQATALFLDHMAKLIDKYRSWFKAAGEHKVHEENAELRVRNAELEMNLESIRKELLEQQMSVQQGPQNVNVQESPEGSMETIPAGLPAGAAAFSSWEIQCLMMSNPRISHASPAYQIALVELGKLLQETGRSADYILSRCTATSAKSFVPEVSDVRTSLSMGMTPAITNSGQEAQTNFIYEANVLASSLGPTQFQASSSNIAQCLDVQNWNTSKHSSLTGGKKSSDVLDSRDKGTTSNEDALRGLLEDIKNMVCTWSSRHKAIVQEMPSRNPAHDEVAVNPGLGLPNGASCPVGFEREQSTFMCLKSLGGNASGEEGLQGPQGYKEEVKRQGDLYPKQNDGWKRAESVQQNQVENGGGLLFQEDKEARHMSFETDMEKSVHLDKVVDDIARQLQSDDQPTIVHSQDRIGRDLAAPLPPQGSNTQLDSLTTSFNVTSTAADTGSTPLLKENDCAAESVPRPTNMDQTEVKLPITKWTPPKSAEKAMNKSLFFPRAVEVITSPDWLPEGWVTELKTRGSGNSAGSKDKYYVDPVSHRRFRSRKEVIAYLDRGSLKSNDDSPETNPVKKFPAPELLPSIPNKSTKKAKLKENGTSIASAMPPPPMVPSIASPGLLGNVFMPSFRTGQPSEWLVYESLASLPFPMFDPFYYKDFNSSKSSIGKGSHAPTRPWFFTGPEASWNPFMDRSSLGKSGEKTRDYQSYFSMPSYPSEVGSKSSAGAGLKKSSKRKSGGL
ncbi:hypothetical protein L7F22_065037 [Adiantum nelumboides]|nr:hypothetical protein [Adiantum nelumboides]